MSCCFPLPSEQEPPNTKRSFQDSLFFFGAESGGAGLRSLMSNHFRPQIEGVAPS